MSIELKHVDYIYEENSSHTYQALKDINLTIGPEEFIGIIGHTGSGKSTLIQHLNGLMRPTHGEVLYDGQDIFQSNFDLRALRGEVGLCFQYPEHQLFEVTILDDVCFGPMNYGKSKEEAKEIAKECLRHVGIGEELFGHSPFELSGGQKRRVAIAGILALEPKYLILDEPTAGLDPTGRDQMMTMLKFLNETKKITIILVSHDMEGMAKYAKRLLVMNEGNLVYDDAPREVFAHQQELEAMGLSLPFYCYLAEELIDHGIKVPRQILSMEEAKDDILAALGRRGKDA